MQSLLFYHIFLAIDAQEAKPVELTDWSTGWGSVDPGVTAKIQRIVQEAKDKEHQAQQELQVAREEEKKAEDRAAAAEKACTGNGVVVAPSPAPAPPLSGDKVITFPIPQTKEVTNAESQAHKAQDRAKAAAKEAEEHAARAEEAVQKAKAADGFVQDEAEKQAADEKAESDRLHNVATITLLQSQLAEDKVQVMKLQALRGSQMEELSTEPMEYMAFGGVLVGLVAVLFKLFSKQEDTTMTPLKEPLISVSPPSPYKEPEWTQESGEGDSDQDWRSRALEVQQLYKDTKLAHDQLKVAAAEQKALADELVGEAERRTAQAEVAASQKASEAEQLRTTAELAKTEVEQARKEAAEAKDNEPVFFTNVSESALKEREAEIEELKDRLQELQTKSDGAEAAKAEVQADLAKGQEELSFGKAEVERLKHELISTNAKAAELTSEVEFQRQMSSENETRAKSMAEECALLKDVLEKLEKFKEELTVEKESLKEELTVEKESLKEALDTATKELEEAKQAAEATKEAADSSRKRAEDAEGSVAQYKEQLGQAKKSAVEASIALAAVRKQASMDNAEGKKALEVLAEEKTRFEAEMADLKDEVSSEKSRADLAENLAKSRQTELTHTQQLAEKAKAALQTVRQELGSECSAAKAQVDVERKLAMESEELAEKCRLEAQAARSAEQEARVAEQEAKAALLKMQRGSTSPRGEVKVAASAEQWRKELSAAQSQTEEARASERRLQDSLMAAEAKDKKTSDALAEAKSELEQMRALYAESAAAKAEAEQELLQVAGQAKAATEALEQLTQAQTAEDDLSKAAGS